MKGSLYGYVFYTYPSSTSIRPLNQILFHLFLFDLSMSSSGPQKADANLWPAYALQLKKTLSQVPSLSPDSRFYVAPLSAAGIAAGKRFDNEIKQNGV